MENLSEETKQALNQLAFNQSVAFCYHCYISAPTGCCSKCHSDDLMRMVPGIGVEYGLCRCQHNPYYAEHRFMLRFHR